MQPTAEVRGPWKVNWICEKWSQEAVDFTRRKLEHAGVTHIAGPVVAVKPKLTLREAMAERVLGREIVPKIAVPSLMPIHVGISSAMLRRFIGAPEEVAEVAGNLLVNEGIQRMIDLIIAVTSNQTAANAYGSTNAYVGVGDSSAAEAATQTELQAATNRFYKAMNATYPSRTNQTVSFQSDFVTAEANYVWAEWSVTAGATVASGSGFTTGTTNMNRKVAALGTKATGTWTLTAQVTIS